MPKYLGESPSLREGAAPKPEAMRFLTMPDLEAPHYLQCVTLDRADESFLAEWQVLHNQQSPDLPMTDPEWFRGDYLPSEMNSLSVYSLHQHGRLRGAAAVARREWPIKWHLGDIVVATLPLTRLRILGGMPDLPCDDTTYDLLFQKLADSPHFDAVHLEEVPVDSFLWKYLHRSEIIRKQFVLYQPDPPAPRQLLRFDGLFEQYLRQFSSKHRVELSRRVRRLKEGSLGEMRFVRFESADQIPEFMEHAQAVSRKTYQWKLHERGLSDTERVRVRLHQDARHGWMRSYILFCGGQPCAFRASCQYRDRFLSYETGFDPALAKHSVGTVLEYLTIQDLFEYRRPAIFDFQDFGSHKEVWATESFLQGKLILFRPSAYTRFALMGHQVCRATSNFLSSRLDRLGWKSYLRQRVRNWKKVI